MPTSSGPGVLTRSRNQGTAGGQQTSEAAGSASSEPPLPSHDAGIANVPHGVETARGPMYPSESSHLVVGGIPVVGNPGDVTEPD
jgi:hypothetical protein